MMETENNKKKRGKFEKVESKIGAICVEIFRTKDDATMIMRLNLSEEEEVTPPKEKDNTRKGD